jgi:hypothetical protein
VKRVSNLLLSRFVDENMIGKNNDKKGGGVMQREEKPGESKVKNNHGQLQRS